MTDKQTLLNHLKNDIYVRIKKSGVHGVGLFAIRDIPKGANPFASLHKPSYIPFNDAELKKSLPEEIYTMIDEYCGKEQNTLYIPIHGFNPIDLPYLINHSDTPNVSVDPDGENFVTMREIKKGEELFSDFSTYHDESEPYIKK